MQLRRYLKLVIFLNVSLWFVHQSNSARIPEKVDVKICNGEEGLLTVQEHIACKRLRKSGIQSIIVEQTG